MDTYLTAAGLVKKSDNLTKSVMKTLDAKFIAIKTSRPASTSAGNLLARLISDDDTPVCAADVLTQIARVKSDIKGAFTDAEANLDAAHQTAEDLRQAVSYLGDRGGLPSGLPESVKSALVQVKSARSAAPDVAPTLSAVLDDTADEIDERVSHMRAVVARRKAASDVGCFKGSADIARKAGEDMPEAASRFEIYRKRAKIAAHRAEIRWKAVKNV